MSKVRDIRPRLAGIYIVVSLLVAYSEELLALFGEGGTTVTGAADGTFTARTAVATMLVGGIVSFAVSTFKRSIPFQYGIRGREFGSRVIAVNTALKVGWIVLALVALLV